MDDLATIEAELAGFEALIATWWEDIDRELQRIMPENSYPTAGAATQEAFSLARIRVGEGPWEGYYHLIDGLADIYLQTTPEQRERIRSFFDGEGKRHVRDGLHGYISRAAKFLEETRDPKWLWRGLAAGSIEDQRIDWRDTLVTLGELYVAARRVHIRPKPYFKAVAQMSNTVDPNSQPSPYSTNHPFLRPILDLLARSGPGSTKAMLEHFRPSLYYQMRNSR
jgi:hypothetical protein